MPQHRRTRPTGRAYSASRARRTSRQMSDSTIGTHVARRGVQQRHVRGYTEGVVRKARFRSVIIGVIAVVIVIGIAVGAGFMAFRGVIGGAISLKDSDARDALVAVKAGEPSYILFTVELGAVADSLENEGPDVILLGRLDPENHTFALVNVPSGLQITSDNQSASISSIGAQSDAKMISALSNFAKIDISHIVKMTSAQDVASFVDALGGVQIDVSEVIDDPHAGSVCIPEGNQTLDGKSALTFLRATNIEYGYEDRLINQLDFATQVVANVFSSEGNIASRLDSISPYIQTDYSLGDIESLNSWLRNVNANDISTAIIPGYFTVVTNVKGVDEGRYVSTSAEVAELIGKLESNEKMSANSMGAVDLVSPSSFTVSIQNGTNVEGAASSMADLLKKDGFNVGDVGNAENPIYDETIVVYKNSDEKGLSRAKTVIDAIDIGRAVNGEAYYSFDSDILLIIGADNKPVS